MSKKKIDGVPKKHRFKLKKRKPNRSRAGDFFLYLFLFLVAIIMVFPLVFAVSSALKPLEELFMFPPKIFACLLIFRIPCRCYIYRPYTHY